MAKDGLERTPAAADARYAEAREDGARAVPAGPYCYEILRVEAADDGSPVVRTSRCPFWASDPARGEQESGYCALLRRGDWEEGLTFLWDQVKACGINEDDVIDGDGRAA